MPLDFLHKKKDEPEMEELESIKQISSKQDISNTKPKEDTIYPPSEDETKKDEEFINPFVNEKGDDEQMPSNMPETMPTDDTINNDDLVEQDFESMGSQSNYNEGRSLTNEEIKDLIEENVEKILDDKWGEIIANIEKILKWKNDLDKRFSLVINNFEDIDQTFGEFQKKILNKIDNYDSNILDINSEMKALEKVFQKITPVLVNNVNELSRITNELKEIKNPSTQLNFSREPNNYKQ